MPTREILLDIQLNSEEERKLKLHSFINVINVIYGVLQILEGILEQKGTFTRYLSDCKKILDSVTKDTPLVDEAPVLENFAKDLLNDTEHTISRVVKEKPEKRLAAEELYQTLENVLEIVDLRLKELLARKNTPGTWQKFSCKEIEDGLKKVFDAMAQNSRKNFGIVYQKGRQSPRDYFIDIDITGRTDKSITLPPPFIDSLRDLTANARKYSDPGSSIFAGLGDGGEYIVLQIKDEGRGIPEDEIEDVVAYGKRGSNSLDRETKGGGFGLTKAYYLCKQYNGRMWIQTEEDKGTEITIRIPKPASTHA